MMELKLILLAIVISLYATEAARNKTLGGADYLPCESCSISKDQYPEEGRMACYHVKRSTKMVVGRERKCKTTKCDPFDFFCVPQTTCTYRRTNVSILDCELALKGESKEIRQRNETYGTIYQINTPQFFINNTYPNNMYCVWNIANEGLVTYRIIDQRLQEPGDCEGPGCDCPDSMSFKMGVNEAKLCGSKMPPMANHMSSDGLKVKFCSDHLHGSKGILVMAYRYNNQSEVENVMTTTNRIFESRKRRQEQLTSLDSCADVRERVNEMSNNMSRMGCQYEFMMRMAQPGVPCPDDDTILELVKTHDYMMAGYQQTMPMCDGMDEMTNRMPMMNGIESCAVDYLYRTRDCKFAKSLLDFSNGELNDVARMIAENNFPIKVPKWLDITRSDCKRDN